LKFRIVFEIGIRYVFVWMEGRAHVEYRYSPLSKEVLSELLSLLMASTSES